MHRNGFVNCTVPYSGNHVKKSTDLIGILGLFSRFINMCSTFQWYNRLARKRRGHYQHVFSFPSASGPNIIYALQQLLSTVDSDWLA
jgi:hypothetical protein